MTDVSELTGPALSDAVAIEVLGWQRGGNVGTIWLVKHEPGGFLFGAGYVANENQEGFGPLWQPHADVGQAIKAAEVFSAKAGVLWGVERQRACPCAPAFYAEAGALCAVGNTPAEALCKVIVDYVRRNKQ